MAKTSFDFIIVVSNDINSDRRMHRIADTLIQAGQKVLILGTEHMFSESLIPNSFHQKRIKCWAKSGILFYLELNFRIFIRLLNYKTRVIYAVDLDTLLGSLISTRIKRKKIIFDAHEFFTEVPELKPNPIKRSIWNTIGKWFIPRSDLRITVAQHLSTLLNEKYKSHFHVIRNLPKYKTTYSKTDEIPNGNFVIIYQGKLNQGRGIESLITSIKYIDDANLWLVGDGDLSNELHAKINISGYSDRIKFFGWVPPDQLHSLTCQAHLGLNILDPTSQSYYYSLANKYFDYIMAEIPILTMNFPEYRDMNRDFEVAILIDDIEEATIEKEISKIINDTNRWLQMKKECHNAKEIYTWETESKKLISILQPFFDSHK